MNSEDEDLATRALNQRKRRDQALVLPIAGAFLLLSPLIGVFADAGRLSGVPVILLYIPLVWLGLILAAWRLSRRIEDDAGHR